MASLVSAQALAACPQLAANLRSDLLTPSGSKAAEAPPSLQSCAIPRPLREALASCFNALQQNAVAACLAGLNQFTLVQVDSMPVEPLLLPL